MTRDNSNKRPIPIGLDDFKKIRENNYCYIDKSLLIAEVLSSGSEVTLFTRPRRFGKTLNLSMLKYFLSCNTQSSEQLFKGLHIEKVDSGKHLQHRNKYPVVFVSFKDLPYKNKESFFKHFSGYLAEICHEFRYLLDSQATTQEQRQWLSDLLSCKADETLLQFSLKRLTMLLEQHHNVKPFVLIDEYDAPIHSAFLNGCYDECIAFMRPLYGSVLKGNAHLNKGIMTGILRVAKESIFSGLNNPNIFSVTAKKCSNYFGLTEQEVILLLETYEKSEYLSEIKRWYNGYCFGDTASIYNPWSILKWLDDSAPNSFSSYWLNTSSNDLIRALFFAHKAKLQKNIFKILAGENLPIKLTDDLNFPSLKTDCSNFDYFTLLLHSGYLTNKNDLTLPNDWISIGIPNEEIKKIFSNIVELWLKQYAPNLSESMPLHILTSLKSGNLKAFQEYFSEVVLQVMSYHDFTKHPENAFHCFTAGFLSWLAHDYVVRSNRESGNGRSDIYLLPRDKSLPGYIFELKFYKPRKKGTKLSSTIITKKLNEALKQIEEKNYTAELNAQGVKDVRKIGMLLYKKKVWFKEA